MFFLDRYSWDQNKDRFDTYSDNLRTALMDSVIIQGLIRLILFQGMGTRKYGMRAPVILNDRHKQTPVISEHQSLNNFWISNSIK